MAIQYSVTVDNKANHSDYFMIYQDNPSSWTPSALALVWFAKFSNPGGKVRFTWSVEWGFSWAETGTLTPGIEFIPSELFDASSGHNMVTFDYQGGVYRFSNPASGPDPSRLYLNESAGIPMSSHASVGVAMAGHTVYAAQARPNMQLVLSAHPRYYLAYGNYQQGEVIDANTISNPLALVFPTGVYALNTTLNADGSWSPPTSLAQANALRLQRE